MGRPTTVKAIPAGTTRRGFFKRSSSVALAAAALPALTLNAQAASAAMFQHGVASGDPLANRVILWTRISPAVTNKRYAVNVVVATDPALTQVVLNSSVFTTAKRDFTVKIDASGLNPATTYYYQFSCEGEVSPVGRTRTLPVGDVSRLRLAVVSCSNLAYGYFNVYARIAARADLDAVVHLGDYIYEYGDGQYGSARALEPSTEILSLADYRMRHAQYKRDADSQAMHRQHPLIAIWDDHETANNSWKDGAENHTPGTEGAWADRVAAALQAYYEWMPVRTAPPIRANERNNARNFRFGKLMNLFMLEERLNARSEQLPQTHATGLGPAFLQSDPGYADPARGLLGADEENWLKTGLRASTTTWKFLGQGVMFAQLKAAGYPNAYGGGAFLNSDQWDGYQPARDRIYSVIKGTDGGAKVSNVVVLTGDIHSAWAADLTQDPNNPDTTTGGYNPATGEGSVAVEFVGTSVTSPGVNDPGDGVAGYLKGQNPHFKHIDLNHRGYMLLDVTPARVNTEYWMVDTVAAPSTVETFSVAFQVAAGAAHLTAGSQTTPKADPPPLAP